MSVSGLLHKRRVLHFFISRDENIRWKNKYTDQIDNLFLFESVKNIFNLFKFGEVYIMNS